MKRYGLIGIAILVITSLAAPVFAWELSHEGRDRVSLPVLDENGK